MTTTELLAKRHREYAKALERHERAMEQWRAEGERVQALERELADAEDEDRVALGEALIDGTKPPSRKAERARAALAKAKAELEALHYAVQRAGQAIDRRPGENRRAWLRQAEHDFQRARADYEQLLAHLIEARDHLEQEALVLSFLIDGQTSSVRMAHALRVSVSGVDGLVQEVPTADVLEALRDELVQLEGDALIRARGGHNG